MERLILQPPQGAESFPGKHPGPKMSLLVQWMCLGPAPYGAKLFNDILGTKSGLPASSSELKSE